MTDEEMAEEYLDEKCKDCYMCSYSEHKNPYKICQRRKDRKQAYLAGLKAGRPQWHDLRKDPNDLPDEGSYLVVWQNARGYRDTMIMRYEEDDEEKLHWIDGEGDCWDDDVIAWREIPKFEEAD